MNRIKLVVIALAMFLPITCMADNELAYAVLHLCQKHLAEKETADRVDDILRTDRYYLRKNVHPKPMVLDVLAEEFKRDSLLKVYYEKAYFAAVRNKLDYAQLDTLVNEIDDVNEMIVIQNAYEEAESGHWNYFRHVVLDNMDNNYACKPLVVEAPLYWIDSNKHIIDSIVSANMPRLLDEQKRVKEQLKEFFGYTEHKATKIAHNHVEYLQNNLPVFYTNLLYSNTSVKKNKHYAAFNSKSSKPA